MQEPSGPSACVGFLGLVVPVPRISRSEPDDIYIMQIYAMRFEEIRIDLNMPHTFPRIPPALAQKKPDLPKPPITFDDFVAMACRFCAHRRKASDIEA